MYEHPSFTYGSIIVEQERVDRANEMRRIIAENPSRIIPRAHPVLDRMRGWFRAGRADAVSAATSVDGARAVCDHTARPAHAR
ncbi:hypothetical protein GCM10027421_13760 [Microbacterium shaanxiense]